MAGRRDPDDVESTPGCKHTNPKDLLGQCRLPLSLWPAIATAHGSLALLDGAQKYGRSNWRVMGVRASIYYDACLRHLSAWFEGEDVAPDSGVHHLGHALACIGILLDAQAAGKLTDDRLVKGGYLEQVPELTELVEQIKENHKDKSPRHYTIKDSEGLI